MKSLVAVMFIALILTLQPRAVEGASLQKPQRVLEYLDTLEGKQVLVGQFGMFGEQTDATTAQQALNAIYQRSGLYPAITGADFVRPDKGLDASIAETVAWLAQKWNEGYLVTASWHAYNPCGGNYNWPTEGARMDLRRVLPGGNCRSAYLAALDKVAAGLMSLQQQGVVVLWRPFHEMNGTWFWWGGQPREQFTQLWRDQYQYFQQKGLTNLLWVYAPNAPRDKWSNRADGYYPGDEVVDIVGLDEYMPLTETMPQLGWGAAEAQNGYLQLAKIDKPLILAEFGPIPASGDGASSRAFNWAALPQYLHERFPKVVAFVAWEYVWQIGRAPYYGQSGLMTNALSVTRDKLPGFVDTITIANEVTILAYAPIVVPLRTHLTDGATPDEIGVSPIPNISLQPIESNDSNIGGSLNWRTLNTIADASAGNVVVNKVMNAPLVLHWHGRHFEIAYASSPSFGTYRVEVDGTVLSTVDSSTAATATIARVGFDLSNADHVLRIIPTNGIVAIDAFYLDTNSAIIATSSFDAQAVVPVTPEPALPTIAPDAVVLPSDLPLLPSAPVNLQPFSVPLFQTMDDNAPLWSATTGWRLDGNFAYSGLSWSATPTGQLETLSLIVPVNLSGATTPRLSFQSRLASAALPELRLSTDNASWQTIMYVTPSTDWALMSVDLGAYAGQMIYIRFAWASSANVADTWQVDEVSITADDLLVMPTVEPPVVAPGTVIVVSGESVGEIQTVEPRRSDLTPPDSQPPADLPPLNG